MERVWWHRLVRVEHSKGERERRRRWEENKSLAKSGEIWERGRVSSKEKRSEKWWQKEKRRVRWVRVREQKLSRFAWRRDDTVTPTCICIILQERQRVLTTADLCVKTRDWEFTATDSEKPEESHSWVIRYRHYLTAPLIGRTRGRVQGCQTRCLYYPQCQLSSNSWVRVCYVSCSFCSLKIQAWSRQESQFHNYKTNYSSHFSEK